MPWRKWFVRSLVFGILGACGAIGLVYQSWTNPSAVREQVVAKLQALYPGAIVSVDSARLRILGGVVVNGLRMSRRDDPDKNEFLHVPSAFLYHDKEKVLDGQMTIRKVELNRPHLRVVRQRDGTWNLQGLVRPGQTQVPLPTVVIHQGTVALEDRLSGSQQAPLEVGDVDMSFINDPLASVNISGSANSPLVGQLRVKGNYLRAPKELTLSVRARSLPLNSALLQRFNASAPGNQLASLVLDTLADVDANLVYHAERTEDALEYGVRLGLSQGKLEHPLLPLPLSELRASLECTNGVLRVADFHARAGTALVKGQGSTLLRAPDKHFDANLEMTQLNISSELAARLPEKIRKLQQAFQASGPSKVRVACARRDGKWTNPSVGGNSRITLLPEAVQMTFVKFPYTLHKAAGSVEWDLEKQSIQVDITSYAGARPVLLRGVWQGEEANATASFDIQASGVPIEEKLIAALPPKLQKVANSFHPTGTVDVKTHLRRQAGSKEFYGEYHIGLRDGTVCWDEFPYPLEKVSGFLDIYPKRWEFREGTGSFRGAEVTVQAQSKAAPTGATDEGDGLSLEIAARGLGLDEHLHKALTPMPQLAKAWETFRPRGRMNFSAGIEKLPGQAQDIDLQLDVRGCSMTPQFFPYSVGDLSGHFRFSKNRLTIKNVRARHDETRLEMDEGSVELRPGGAYYVDLQELRMLKLHADAELVAALPKPMQNFIGSLELKDAVNLKTRLVVAQAPEPTSAPELWWDGQLVLNSADVTTGVPWKKLTGTLACTGRHDGHQLQGLYGNFLLDEATLFKQPFKKVHGKFYVKENMPEVMTLGLYAPIFGGDITGQVRLELTSAGRYELNLTASQIDLKEFGQHNLGPSSQLSGIAVGRLHLTGMGNSSDTLDGNCSIDVPNGKLYNLPLLLDLLKFLGLRWPDRTAFEELHALLSINGQRVTVRRLELTGNAVSLSGKGDFKLDGTELNLDFSPTWARFEQMLPTAVRPMPSAISKNLLTIEVRGKVSSRPEELRFNKKLVPILFDPLLFVRNRMMGASAAPAGN